MWMQIKLGILSIQTFVWQHEHAVSRFQIWWALKPLGLLMPRPPARTALWFKICLWNLLKINESGECIRLLTFGCLVSHGRKLALRFWGYNQRLPLTRLPGVNSIQEILCRNFKIISRNFKILSRNFELLSRNFELLSRNFKILSRNFELLSRNFELLSQNFDLLCWNFELLSWNFEILCRNFEIISRNFEILSRNFSY